MKRILSLTTLFFGALVALSTGLKAESKNILNADLSSSILGFAYERVFNEHFSLQLALQYSTPWYISAIVEETDVTGVGGGIRPFIFFQGNYYISPFFRYAQIQSEQDLDQKVEGTGYATGATIGFLMNDVWDAFIVKLGIGFEYWNYTIEADARKAGYEGWFGQVDILVGLPF